MARPSWRLRLVAPFVGFSIALAAASEPVHAGNRHSYALGSEAALNGGTLVAHGRGPAMAWYNPAGLASVEARQVEVSADAFVLRLRSVPEAVTLDLPGNRTLGTDLNTRQWLIVPTTTALAWSIRGKVTLGVSAFVPEQDETNVEAMNETMVDDLSVAQQVKVVTTRRRYHLGASVGFSPIPSLSLGVSAFLVLGKEVITGRLWATASQPGAQFSEVFGSADIFSVSRRFAGEVTLGAQWRPVSRLSLGLLVRTPRFAITERVDSSTVSTGYVEFGDDVGVAALVFDDDPALERPPRFEPVQVVVGAAWSWEDGEVAAEAEYSPPTAGGDDRGRKQVLNGRVGVRSAVTERLALGGGIFTDFSDVPNADDFADTAVDYYGLAFGASLDTPLGKGRNGRSNVSLVTAVGLRYALGIGSFGQLRVDVRDLGRGVGATAGGEVDMLVHDLGFSLSSGLQF